MKGNWKGPAIVVLVISFPAAILFCGYFLLQMMGLSDWGAFAISSIAAIVFGFLFFSFQDFQTKRALKFAKQLALSKGFEIEERMHPITYYDADPKDYEEAPENFYGLKYRFPQKAAWALRIPKSRKGDYPNGWKLIVKKGEVSDFTKTAISKIAADLAADGEFSESGMEIESYPEKVWVVFDPGAGKKVVNKAFDIVQRMSELME